MWITLLDFLSKLLYTSDMVKDDIQKAIELMSKQVGRDSKHIYRNSETGEMYQGVSTVSSIIPKDWLAAWGAKEAVKALGYTDYSDTVSAMKVLEKIKECTVPQYIEILKEAKGAHARKSKKAMVDGTLGHKWLETNVESRLNAKEPPIVPVGEALERPVTQFLEWEEKNVGYWIASEALVSRPDKSYAGQLDGIYMSKSKRLCLVDFKFASNISEDYYLQSAGYAACFEPYGILFDDRIIIRLPKTLEREVYENFKYKMVPNDIEVHVVPTKYEVDRDAFFAALKVKGWINYVTNNK